MKSFRIGIEANPVFPYYMQHRMDDTKLADWEKNRGKIMERPELSKEDNLRAEYHAYRDERGYYIPTEHILGAIKIASKEFKSKTGSGRKSMKDEVAGGFFIQGDENP